MSIGGIEKSLIELLRTISSHYDISLFCVDAVGALLNEVPKEIKIITGNTYSSIPEKSFNELRKSSIIYALLRLLFSSLSSIGLKKIATRLFLLFFPLIRGEFDVAISYSQPISDKSFCKLSNEIVLFKCRARKKITFLHCDFEKYEGNTAYNRKLYEQFDAIAAVSDSVKAVFAKCTGIPVSKQWTIYNICNADVVRELSNADDIYYSHFCFVIVARLSKEKGIERVIKCSNQLRSEGYSFEVHIIGGGYLENSLHETICKNNLQNVIYLHGQQNNPYIYMKNANCLLLPSYHEASPMVFLEAMALGLPVITTNTLSAVEIVEKHESGVVCENTDNGIYDSMKNAITNGIFINNEMKQEKLLTLGKEQFSRMIEELMKDVY